MSVIWPCLTARETGKYIPALFSEEENSLPTPSLISIKPDIYSSPNPMHMLYVRLIKPIKAGAESAYFPLYSLQACHIVGSQ